MADAFYNNILQKLEKLFGELELLEKLYKECDDISKRTKSSKTEMHNGITNSVESCRKKLYSKLESMTEKLRDHQKNQQSESIRLQQEISLLKKEKLDLYQKINQLQKRVVDMENTIGSTNYDLQG